MLISGTLERVYRAQPNRRFIAARNYNFFDPAPGAGAAGLGPSKVRGLEQGAFTGLASLW
jgi:hypothetical protein